MAARTAATVTALVRDGGIAQSSANSAHSSGEYVAGLSGSTGADIRKLVLVVVNGDSSSHNVIIRAAGTGNNVAGTAQTSPYPSNAVLTQGSVGDLTVTVVNATTQVIWLPTSDRFLQPDGNLYIDWSATTSMTFYVYQVPFVLV